MTTTFPHSPHPSGTWSDQALSIAAQARVVSGNKLEQLVVRLQRHTGRTKDACWRFIRQYGLKDRVEHRRWSDAELDMLREELVKNSVDEVARKLHRSPRAIRSVLLRNNLRVREIRADQFSLESLSAALHVSKPELLTWIDRGWLPASITESNGRKFYTITPENLQYLYKNHQQDLLRRGRSNLLLFEAYVQYCHSPKHTTGEHLLDVRRDKRERKAFEAVKKTDQMSEQDDFEEGDFDESRYGIAL